jgi:hypothetical protein
MKETSIAIAVVALALVAGASAAGPPAMRACGVVPAAHWSAKGQSGSTYTVRAGGSSSCAFARTRVRMLTHANAHSRASELRGTPSGYACLPLITARAGAGVLAGLCTKDNNPLNEGFSWAPVGLRLR